MCLEDINRLSVKGVYFRVEFEPIVERIQMDLDINPLGRDACGMHMNS